MSENETIFCYLIANADAEMSTDISKLNNGCPTKSCKWLFRIWPLSFLKILIYLMV